MPKPDFETDTLKAYTFQTPRLTRLGLARTRIGVIFKKEQRTIYRNFYENENHNKHIRSFLAKLDQDAEYKNSVLLGITAWQWLDAQIENLITGILLVKKNQKHPIHNIQLRQQAEILRKKARQSKAPMRMIDLRMDTVELGPAQVPIGLAVIYDILQRIKPDIYPCEYGHRMPQAPRAKGPAVIRTKNPRKCPPELTPFLHGSQLVLSDIHLADLNDRLIETYPHLCSLKAYHAQQLYKLSTQFVETKTTKKNPKPTQDK
jgi:hypothetical protein